MKIFRLQTFDLKIRNENVRRNLRTCFALFLFIAFAACTFGLFGEKSSAQTAVGNFRVGERLTYNFSFERFKDVAYAEIYAVSRGRLEGKDAVELQAKFKTLNLFSAAFYMIDENRTTFASVENGLPLFTKKVSNAGVSPIEEDKNYLVTPATNYDLLTMIYQARNANGVGNFQFQENGKIYNANFTTTGNEKVTTDAGDFDTAISLVQSDFLTENGIRELRINFSSDEKRIPVLIRIKTVKGEFRGSLSSVQNISDAPENTPTPNQTPIVVVPTPRPIVTPTPYINNQPLLPELPFDLGETLQYQVSNSGKRIATITLQAKERKQFLNPQPVDPRFPNEDSLLLTAIVTGSEQANQILNLNDGIRAQVNPDTLTPKQIDLKFSGFFSTYNQTTLFDQRTGSAIYDGANRIEIPVGTHSILSLVYAIRSFNLKPSKDETNPVNDTRVAVFLGKQPYVFTLRPANADLITLRDEKLSAQMITVITGNPSVDAQGLKIWLSNDEKRIPLRLTFGTFQADLIKESIIPPK